MGRGYTSGKHFDARASEREQTSKGNKDGAATDWKPRGDATHAEPPHIRVSRDEDGKRTYEKRTAEEARQSGTEKDTDAVRGGTALNGGRSSSDEVVTVWLCGGGGEGGERENRRRRRGGGGENLRRFHAWREPRRNGPARPGRQPCWLHGRQAAASQLTAAAHYTGRGREGERKTASEQETLKRGGTLGRLARAREKSRGESVERASRVSQTGP